MKTVTDKFGQEIYPGAFIVYGHALGRCAGLRVGKVLSVKKLEPTCGLDSDCRVLVQGVDDDFGSKTPKLTSRAGTLQFSRRIVVLDPRQVPTEIHQLFSSPCSCEGKEPFPICTCGAG